MTASLFETESFLDIIASVYALRRVDLLDRGEPGYVPFFASVLPFRSGSIFNLPFGFNQPADYFEKRWQTGEWQRIGALSRKTGRNVTVSTLGPAPLGDGLHCANNPVLGLRSMDDPAHNYSANLRSNLRKERNKCQRLGIEIAISSDEADLLAFYQILARQYVREHRMVFNPVSLYRRLFTRPDSLLVVAKQAGKVVGGMFLLADGNTLRYHWGARGSVENVSVGTVLIDFAIRLAQSRGFAVFDFGSTPLSDRHLFDFKMRWGCTNLQVFKYYTLRAPEQVDLNASFLLARRLFSHLPIGVAQALMPWVVPWLVN